VPASGGTDSSIYRLGLVLAVWDWVRFTTRAFALALASLARIAAAMTGSIDLAFASVFNSAEQVGTSAGHRIGLPASSMGI